MLPIKDVDSVYGDNVLVVVHKNPREVPMKTALTTKMPRAMEMIRFVLDIGIE